MSLKKTPDFLQNIFRKKMTSGSKRSYRFKTFILDVGDRQLLNDNAPVALTPKVFDVLVLLVERAGHLVEKEELMQSVWSDSFVEDANLSRAIHTLRKALGEDNDGNKFITTVAKKGYRFVAEVTKVAEPDGEGEKRLAGEYAPSADAWPGEIEDVLNDKEYPANVPLPGERQPRYLLAALAVVVFTSLGLLIAFTWSAAESAGSERDPVSIVILPFRPYSAGDRDEDYDLFFADFLIAQLSQGSKNLEVRPISSMRNYLDVKQDAIAIGREQKAHYVFESNYTVEDGLIRGTWRLLNVGDGSVEATAAYSHPGSDRYTTAEQVVLKLAPELLANLKFAPVKPVLNRGTANEAAWEHYRHGMNLNYAREREATDKAIPEFEQAVALDPSFADAYVGLAFAHESSYINGGKREDHCQKAREAAAHALALAPDLGDAHAIYGINALSCFGERRTCESSFQRALELAPNSPFVRRYYGIYLTAVGRGDESINELRKAIDLEPNLPWTERLLGRALFFARSYEPAIEQIKKARALDQNDIAEQTAYLFMSYERKGDIPNAFEWFLELQKLRKVDPAIIDSFKNIYAKAGWDGVLRKRLEIAEEKERNGAQNYGEIASLAAQVGDKDKAFFYLEKAVPKGQLFMAQLAIDPNLDPLRPDPRFKAIYDQNWPHQ